MKNRVIKSKNVLKMIAKFFVIILFLLSIYFNAGEIFTKQSSKFSVVRFFYLTEGDNISKAIKILGEPVKKHEGSDQHYYCFMDFPNWVVAGRSYWIITDSNGFIERKYRIIEP